MCELFVSFCEKNANSVSYEGACGWSYFVMFSWIFEFAAETHCLHPTEMIALQWGGGGADCVYRWITIQIQLSFSSQFIFPISSAVSSRVVKSTPTPALLTVRFFIWYQRGSSIWKNLKFEIFAWISHIFLKLQKFKHC